MEKRFDSFKDASAYASAVAQEKRAPVRVVRAANAWVVQLPEPEAKLTVIEQESLGQGIEKTVDLHHESDNTMLQSAVEKEMGSVPKTPPLISTESLLSSPEDEWNSFLELASRALEGRGATDREVINEFSRLVSKGNPFAVEAKDRYDSRDFGVKASTAYEQGWVYGITSLYEHGEDTRKPKEWPPDYLSDKDGKTSRR